MLIGIFRSQPVPGYGYIAGEYDPDPSGTDGIVTVLDVPEGGHTIDLFVRETRQWIRSTLSAHDGTYCFPALLEGIEYDVISRHKTRMYTDVIVPARVPWPYVT